jgi:hypothetical protein
VTVAVLEKARGEVRAHTGMVQIVDLAEFVRLIIAGEVTRDFTDYSQVWRKKSDC